MHCPACGTRNQLGSQRCRRCDYPFTRAAASAPGRNAGLHRAGEGFAAAYPAPRAARPRRRGLAFLFIPLALIVVLAGLVIGVLLASNEIVKPMVADRVRDELDNGIRVAVQRQVPTREAGTAGVGGVEEITVTEAELNQSIDAHGSFGPVDDIYIHIRPEGVSVDLSAYGMSGSYTADLLVQNGAVLLGNGQIDGPLRFIVPEGELEQIANEAMTRALQDTGYRVAQVTLWDGAMRFVVE